jgi:hypothetical protein
MSEERLFHTAVAVWAMYKLKLNSWNNEIVNHILNDNWVKHNSDNTRRIYSNVFII